MHKIALQLYGKFRTFEFQKKYWYALKKQLKVKKNIQLDIHLTTWDDEESRPNFKDNLFIDSHLIPYPKDGYVKNTYVPDLSSELKKIKHTGKTSCLFLSQYSMYKSYSNRKKWEYTNNVEYDFIILSRVDNVTSIEDTIAFLHQINVIDSYTLYIGQSKTPIEKLNHPTVVSDDNIFYGSPTAINLLCSSFNYYYRQPHNMYLTHHSNYIQYSRLVNQIQKPKPHSSIVRYNDGKYENISPKVIDEIDKIYYEEHK